MSPRDEMVRVIGEVYGLSSPKVFGAMRKVPRERFVDKKYTPYAYLDTAIPIGFDQTISQPCTVAIMTHLLELKGTEKVLEIGTGSGYQAAILAELAKDVFTIEIIPELAERAKVVLDDLGYKNIQIKVGSGNQGWQDKAPFQRIIVTAAIEKKVPSALFEQLEDGGILVTPMGKKDDQVMTKFVKEKDQIAKSEHGNFIFVAFREDS